MGTTRESAEQYRRRAVELRLLASKMRDENRRDMVLDIAVSYDRLADEFEDLVPK